MLSIRQLSRLNLTLDTLDVEAGDAVAVTGPSGAGKSQLLRAIADLDPNAGEISLNGARRQDMLAPDWRRQVSYVAATPAWWAERVADHFDSPLSPDDATTLLLPADVGDWPVTRLSTGEAVRLALLRALAVKPSVLLLDEPTGPLDEDAERAVEARLRQFLESGGAILMTSHDPAQIRRMTPRQLMIEADGTVSEATP